MNALELEALALDAHRRGDSWHRFYRDHWQDIALLDLHDRGPLQRKLSALVCEGDVCGITCIEDGYARPMDFELDTLPTPTPL